MKRWILALIIAGSATATTVVAEDQAPARTGDDVPAPTEGQTDDAAGDATLDNASSGDSSPPSTGGLRETVTETLRTFTPSEEIDVDKPVDFPANI